MEMDEWEMAMDDGEMEMDEWEMIFGFPETYLDNPKMAFYAPIWKFLLSNKMDSGL